MHSNKSGLFPFGTPQKTLCSAPPSRPSNIVDLLRQTFATVNSAPRTGSTSPRSLQVLRVKKVSGDDCWKGTMSSPAKRHLPDIRYSLSPSPQNGRGDKRGMHYGSAGDVTAISRVVDNLNNISLHMKKDTNNNSDHVKAQQKSKLDNTSHDDENCDIEIPENKNATVPYSDIASQDCITKSDDDLTRQATSYNNERSQHGHQQAPKYSDNPNVKAISDLDLDKISGKIHVPVRQTKSHVCSGVGCPVDQDKGNGCMGRKMEQKESNEHGGTENENRGTQKQEKFETCKLDQNKNDSIIEQTMIVHDIAKTDHQVGNSHSGQRDIKNSTGANSHIIQTSIKHKILKSDYKIPDFDGHIDCVNENKTVRGKRFEVQKVLGNGAKLDNFKKDSAVHDKGVINGRDKLTLSAEEGTNDSSRKKNNTDLPESLEEYGAVGGAYPDEYSESKDLKTDCAVLKNTSMEKTEIAKPIGILHRKPSTIRKTSSVQFSDEITVETFSQTDTISDASTITSAGLAQGDGLTSGHTFDQVSANLNSASESPAGMQISNHTEYRQLASPPTKNKSNSKETVPKKNSKIPLREQSMQRNGSLSKVQSPTHLLRQKQKVVTDKIMQSMTFKPSITKTDHNEDTDDCSTSGESLSPEFDELDDIESLAEEFKHYQAESIARQASSTSSKDTSGSIYINRAAISDPRYAFPSSKTESANNFESLNKGIKNLDNESHQKEQMNKSDVPIVIQKDFVSEMSEIEKIKEKGLRLRERCKRKLRLDSIRKQTQDTNHLSADNKEFRQDSKKLVTMTDAVTEDAIDRESKHVTADCLQDKNDITSSFHSHDAEMETFSNPAVYIHSLLSSVLTMIKEKRNKGLPITIDDYREMECIERITLELSQYIVLDDVEGVDKGVNKTDSVVMDEITDYRYNVKEESNSKTSFISKQISDKFDNLRAMMQETSFSLMAYNDPNFYREAANADAVDENKAFMNDNNSIKDSTRMSSGRHDSTDTIASGYLGEAENDSFDEREDYSLEGKQLMTDTSNKRIKDTNGFTATKYPSEHSGYLGDMSASEQSISAGCSLVNGWSFTNQFLADTMPYRTVVKTTGNSAGDVKKQDQIFYDSPAAESPSINLSKFLLSSATLTTDSEWSITDLKGQLSSEENRYFENKKSQCNSRDRFFKSKGPIKLNESRNGNTTECIAASPYEYGKFSYPYNRSACLQLLANPSFDMEHEAGDNEVDDSEQDLDSLAVNDYSIKSDISLDLGETSSKQVRWMTSVSFPNNAMSVEVELGPSKFTVNRDEDNIEKGNENEVWNDKPVATVRLKEGSPERGQKLYGSSQNLDRRYGESVGKRKQAGRNMTPDSRSFMLEREVTESQNRKLQLEVTTLQTENKLLKEKYNRSQVRISELESDLSDAQDDLAALQENLNREVTDLSTRTKQEIDRGRDELQTKIMVLSKENEVLKAEVTSLEKQLESAHRVTDMARHNSEKARTLEAYKSEINSLKEELNRVKALLDQSERHLREEEERHSADSIQVLKLTELKNALQQQSDTGGSGAITDKQLKSLEKRLKVTEERLHQERSDRANNLSTVEDKLLTENARLQAVEKDLTRQLHREKDKNRNFEHRVKTFREENEKLRLAMPFDDSTLLSSKGNYDIPYSSRSNQRAETMKNISDDMNYILSQIEKLDGLQPKEGEEIIRTLWNKREMAYRQLREYELHFQELQLNDNNIVDGLKNMRDTYSQAESKLHSMEEQVEDARAQVVTLDTTYKQQLNVLVHERHEAFARLKTAEDLLEAVRTENEMLRKNVIVSQTNGGARQSDMEGKDSIEALKVDNTGLESRVAQLTRANQLMEGELNTARVQLDARNKALQDVQCELDLAYNRLQGEEADDRKQQKIDKLLSQVSSLQVELKLWTDKYNNLVTEKSKLESEISTLRRTSNTHKVKHQKTEQVESKALQQLRDDLADKEGRVTSLGKQLDDVENQLQKTRQELYIEQMHTGELESEVEILQQTASQRAQMFESLSGTEREQLAQYQILKDSLDSVSQELAQKHAQIISLDINLSGQKDMTAELEGELAKLQSSKADNDDTTYTEDEQSSAHQLKINELEKERAQLKQELVQAYSAIQASEEQYRTLQTESAQLEQELVKEKTVILQITAEKGEIEQHLEELAEEHDSLIQEKSQAEDDLIKMETKLQEILAKYETEARKQHANFKQQYPNLPPEARKIVSELNSLRLLVEGKDREMDMLQNKINRQHIEMDFLQRKVELVHNDSISNREDVARMISELTLKMKEAVSTREVNQFLVGERTKLQNEKSHLELELEQERKHNDQRRREITDVIRKIEKTETHQKSAEKSSRDKENTITSLESDLRNFRQNVAALETEKSQLKNRQDHLNEDLKNLTSINATLEKRLEMEKDSLSEEKMAVSKWKEDCNRVSHDYEMLRHEHAILSDKYDTELQTIENLRRDLDKTQGDNSSMQEELRNMKFDLDSNRGQLLITKDTVEKLTQDKGTIHQDYEGMCRTLTEKERQLVELRERSDGKMEQMKKEHLQERVRLEQDRAAAVQERDLSKKESDSTNEQLKQKEIQLNTFGKTLQELESVTRQKKNLEAQLYKLESSSGDSKVLLEGQRKELMALNESIAKQQEKMTRLQAENHTVQADLKSQKDCDSREIHELKLTINELKSQHENERHYLNDNLVQTQTTLRSVEASLASAANGRDTVNAQKRLQDKKLEDLEAQLSDECTGRRLAEQSVGSLRLQLEDMRNEKNVGEARLVEWKNQQTKAEEQLKQAQEKNKKLGGRLQELTAISHTTESSVKAKSEQVETSQKEISRLKQMIETQKQNMTGKLKKSALEFKQQMDLVQEDKDKLQLQAQQLSTDLDTCREQIASKNKDNLKLQEQILVMEDSLRESQARQKQAHETLKVEAERQTQLSTSDQPGLLQQDERFRDQDEELKRLRNFLAKKVEESGEADKSMWHEMNRVIQELSRQMQDHLDAKGSRDHDTKPGGDLQLLRYKKLLSEVQGELSTEKSLHQITKTSLQALEEDCGRLRQQMRSLRRRDPPSSEKKYKNRMEAINAIIARSQTQAQALLASGGYLDESMVSPRVLHHTPRVGFHSPHRPESPDNSYSEDLSIASLPPMHYGSQTKKSSP